MILGSNPSRGTIDTMCAGAYTSILRETTMKADKNFRLRKSIKRLLCVLSQDRNVVDVKHMFIDAQLTADRQTRRPAARGDSDRE